MSILNISESMKIGIRNYLNQGFTVYVPQRCYWYNNVWSGVNFFCYSLKSLGGGWAISGHCGGFTAAGVDDDGDNLIDEDSWGRQPWEPFYTNDLMEDDDEDGRFEDGEIVRFDEDPGGFEGGWKWEHIMLLKEYYWVDWTQYGNEDYIKTQGHIYAFIHAHGGKPGSVEEGPGHDQFRYPIVFAIDYPYKPYWVPPRKVWIWNVLFRKPKRP